MSSGSDPHLKVLLQLNDHFTPVLHAAVNPLQYLVWAEASL